MQQVVKRLSEHDMANNLAPNVPDEKSCFSSEHFNGPRIPNIFGKQYSKATVKKWSLTNKKPDNCVYLNNMSVVVVENFIKCHDQMPFIGRKFQIYDNLYTLIMITMMPLLNRVKLESKLWAILVN